MAIMDVLKKPGRTRLARLGRLLVIALLIVPATACATNSHWPPLTSQVVDAETGQPLEGAVVLAYWMRYEATLAGWGGGGFYDAEETVTGPDGRYSIRPRFTYTIPGVTEVRGPELVIFKSGYGPWQRRPSGDTELMALPPAKTPAERLEALRATNDPGDVPPAYKRLLQEAIRQEREYLWPK